MCDFSEILSELVFERGQDFKTFAADAGLSASCISGYLHGVLPSVENLVKLADCLNCSTDYLLGREETYSDTKFSKYPEFSVQIEKIAKEIKPRKIYSGAGISKSRYYDWKSGRRQPSLDSILKIADGFGLRVDHVLGRET